MSKKRDSRHLSLFFPPPFWNTTFLKRMSPEKKKKENQKTTQKNQKQCVQANQRAWGVCCIPTAQPWPPFLSLQPFMSPRYAGGPRPPIRMGNQVRHSQDSGFPRDSWEKGGEPDVLHMLLGLGWQASPPCSPSFSLVPKHQVSLNDDSLILFRGLGLSRVEIVVGNVLLSIHGVPSRAVPCCVLAARLDFPRNRRKLKWWR